MIIDLKQLMEGGATWFKLVEQAMRNLDDNGLKQLDAFLDSFAVDLQNLRCRLRLRMSRHSKENHE
jgi:hypothetical protein